jgi:hypothetical protein
MSILALSLQKNATSGTTVGGTAMALSSDGQTVKNGIHVADMSELNFLIRSNMTLRTRNPVLQSDGSYSKAKRFMTIVVPKIIASGAVKFPLIRIEIEMEPEMTLAEQTNLLLLGAQCFTDADLQSFLSYGSLA